MVLTREIFAERLYQWSFQDAERELREHFPLVARVNGANAAKYVRFFSQLAPKAVPIASRALVKRMNQPLLLRQQASLTEEEEKYVQAFLHSDDVVGPGGVRMVAADVQEPKRAQTLSLRRDGERRSLSRGNRVRKIVAAHFVVTVAGQITTSPAFLGAAQHPS